MIMWVAMLWLQDTIPPVTIDCVPDSQTAWWSPNSTTLTYPWRQWQTRDVPFSPDSITPTSPKLPRSGKFREVGVIESGLKGTSRVCRGRHGEVGIVEFGLEPATLLWQYGKYFLQAGWPSCRPTNSAKALQATLAQRWSTTIKRVMMTKSKKIRSTLVYWLWTLKLLLVRSGPQKSSSKTMNNTGNKLQQITNNSVSIKIQIVSFIHQVNDRKNSGTPVMDNSRNPTAPLRPSNFKNTCIYISKIHKQSKLR